MDNNQIHAGNESYNENFYRGQKGDQLKSAPLILPLVAKFVHPRTVVDVGCGVGGWLDVWQNQSNTEIFGVDGDYVDRSQLLIDEKFFHAANLEERINLNRRFDLAMTLEVAEHLSPERADSFVEDLTKLSDVILFSAAIPAQGGVNHVNEQWPSYWAEKFLRFGYVGIDCLRPKIWHDNNIEVWYRQNIFIYAKSTELYRYPELQEFYLAHRDSTNFDIVHPQSWLGNIITFRNFDKKVQDYLRNKG
ncbi:MAG: methyltransferase domain-containing protein [Selenomonadaceae bacterium]|nr:methyltransferase domain-containing protein [Selenomonadaceae bacterium]